jgi:hypothetical protein
MRDARNKFGLKWVVVGKRSGTDAGRGPSQAPYRFELVKKIKGVPKKED